MVPPDGHYHACDAPSIQTVAQLFECPRVRGKSVPHSPHDIIDVFVARKLFMQVFGLQVILMKGKAISHENYNYVSTPLTSK